MSKIGVYVCYCGGNISDVVDVSRVVESASGLQNVGVVREIEHACSDEGQSLIKKDIDSGLVDRIVVGSCTPEFHEATFAKLLKNSGLNPYLLEIANLREQCSWAHPDNPPAATVKACNLVGMAVSKVGLNEALEDTSVTMGNRVVVIGGGIAGIQSTLDLANAGFKVSLVEREPYLGGNMARLARTFPTEDCASCILAPKMADVLHHDNVDVCEFSDVLDISGHVGDFSVSVEHKPRYIDVDKCTACGSCADVCPVSVPDEFESGMKTRTAIYLPHANAAPRKYLVDIDACTQCLQCVEACDAGAIDHGQKAWSEEIKGDCVILATGYELFDSSVKLNYGLGQYRNVIHALQLERMIVPIGATKGRFIRAFSDKKEVKRVGIVQCVGARDEQIGRVNCGRICCMYGIKHAIFVKKKLPGAEVYLFYTDIRAFGKGYEEYYKKAQDAGVIFIRGRVAEIYETGDENPVVRAEDTLSHRLFEVECDLVSLSSSITPHSTSGKLANMLKIQCDSEGFYQEAHPKYRPVDTRTDGVFICGCAQGPKDIPDTVAQAGAAASRAMSLLGSGTIFLSPVKASVGEACNSCGACIGSCPNGALSLKEDDSTVAVSEVLCDACGACIGSCPEDALVIRHFTTGQLMESLRSLLKDKTGVKIVAFADKSTTYRVLDSIGQQRISYPPSVYPVRVADSSQVTPGMILETFKMGADGVFVGEPEAGSGVHHPVSVEVTIENVKKVKEKLSQAGIEPERLDYGLYITVWTRKLAGQLTALDKTLTGLVPIPREKLEQLEVE